MAALKKMLVARNQFPVPPVVTGVPVKIPSWQQNHQASTSQSDDVKTPVARTEDVSFMVFSRLILVNFVRESPHESRQLTNGAPKEAVVDQSHRRSIPLRYQL